MEQSELALARRHRAKGEELARGTRDHLPLLPGTVVLVQNQVGKNAKKWDKSGVVLADKGHSQYQVRLDGSGRVTLRNRSFLKRIVPYDRLGEKHELGDLKLDRKAAAPGVEETSIVQGGGPERVVDVVKDTAQETVQSEPAPPICLRRSQREVGRPVRYTR